VLGDVAIDRSEYDVALSLHRRALRMHEELADRIGAAYALEGIACAVASLGRSERALRLFGAAQALREAIHSPRSPAEQAAVARYIDRARSAAGEANAERCVAEGRALLLGPASALALEAE
jgi:hypothetical protein